MEVVTAKWTKLTSSERLRRSSQVLSIVEETVWIFGGELFPRQPVDNQIDLINLKHSTVETKSHTSAPSPRVGSACTTLNGKVYIFSGRGGIDMAPIEEGGVLWVFDTLTSSWSTISPMSTSQPYPAARSYHCLTSDGADIIYLHAGCPANGRLSDLWSFSIPSREWTELASAPDPPRGGTSITYTGTKLYRMNGFDGTKEQGGSLDILDPLSNTWSTQNYLPDGISGPEPRSVSALLSLKLRGKPSLVTMFGERDPSSLGHQGAGKMLADAWAYSLEARTWSKINASGDADGFPDARGWFAADVAAGASGVESILVHGGLGESNERLGDIWLLNF